MIANLHNRSFRSSIRFSGIDFPNTKILNLALLFLTASCCIYAQPKDKVIGKNILSESDYSFPEKLTHEVIDISRINRVQTMTGDLCMTSILNYWAASELKEIFELPGDKVRLAEYAAIADKLEEAIPGSFVDKLERLHARLLFSAQSKKCRYHESQKN